MRKEAEKELTKLNKKPSCVFKLIEFIKKEMKKTLKEADTLQEKT